MGEFELIRRFFQRPVRRQIRHRRLRDRKIGHPVDRQHLRADTRRRDTVTKDVGVGEEELLACVGTRQHRRS